LDEIKESVVIAKKGLHQEAFLVAYVLKNEHAINMEEVIIKLRTVLPHYMIPNAVIEIEEFPLTPNKKIDRKALSLREVQLSSTDGQIKQPSSSIEIKLSQFWSEVLNTKEIIGVNDNFFALGGHSLNAVKLIRLIAQEFSLEITLKTIFDNPTIESLALYLQELNPVKMVKLPFAEKKDFYALTPPQYSIWLASQQSKNSMAYNMSAGYIIEGGIDVDRINQSVNQIIQKFEILRTNFVERNGIPYQKIKAVGEVKFEVKRHEFHNAISDEIVEELVNAEFDLENDLLIRFHILELNDNKNLLLFSTHHIIMDGLSLEVFIGEFIKNYNEENDSSEHNIVKFQFKDYSEWFNNKLTVNQVSDTLFWKEYLNNYVPKISIERDFENKKNCQNANRLSFELTNELTLQLKELSISKEVTLYTLLAASINVLIYRLSNHKDIIIGTVNSGRDLSELNEEIGMFVKTLLLRTQINAEQTFIELLYNIKNNIMNVTEHQDIPFDLLPNDVFDVMFAFQNPEFDLEKDIELNGLKLSSYPVNNKFSRMPVVFNLFESNNQLKGIIDYNADLFDPGTIKMIALKLDKILNEIVSNPSVTLNKIDEELQMELNSALDFDFNF
jgi:surfactin family lipopeptide synthetase A